MSTDDPRYYTADNRTRAERRRDLRNYLLKLAEHPRPLVRSCLPQTHAQVMESLTRIHPAAIDDRNARKRERRARNGK